MNYKEKLITQEYKKISLIFYWTMALMINFYLLTIIFFSCYIYYIFNHNRWNYFIGIFISSFINSFLGFIYFFLGLFLINHNSLFSVCLLFIFAFSVLLFVYCFAVLIGFMGQKNFNNLISWIPIFVFLLILLLTSIVCAFIFI